MVVVRGQERGDVGREEDINRKLGKRLNSAQFGTLSHCVQNLNDANDEVDNNVDAERKYFRTYKIIRLKSNLNINANRLFCQHVGQCADRYDARAPSFC